MQSKDHSRPEAIPSKPRAAVTELERRELLEETALLCARRQGRRRWTERDWREAEDEVLRRLQP